MSHSLKKTKRGIAAVLKRKPHGFPKVIICDTRDQGEAEMVMAALNLGDYYFEWRDFTIKPEEGRK